MTYFVIDKDNKVLYHGEDKALAIKTKKETRTAIAILYQFAPDGDKYLLRENHQYEETKEVAQPPVARQGRVSQRRQSTHKG